MTRGGKREGAGRPEIPSDKKAKPIKVWLYDNEIKPVKDFIKSLRNVIIKEESEV